MITQLPTIYKYRITGHQASWELLQKIKKFLGTLAKVDDMEVHGVITGSGYIIEARKELLPDFLKTLDEVIPMWVTDIKKKEKAEDANSNSEARNWLVSNCMPPRPQINSKTRPLFRVILDRWNHLCDQVNMGNATGCGLQDLKDLIYIYKQLINKKYTGAYNTSNRVDSAVRDMIPRVTYDYMIKMKG